MKFAFLIILLAVADISAQSGRVKPAETPAPRPSPKKAGNYTLTNERERVVTPGKAPSPTPTPLVEDDEEMIRVDSTLVPIPLSVIDSTGRAIRNLKLEDIELFIDGGPAPIGEMTRSDNPVRLVMLFDNSGSVLAARKFEMDAAARFFRRVLRPEKDMAALFSVSTVTRLEQPLTPDRELLIDAIFGFPPPEERRLCLMAFSSRPIISRTFRGAALSSSYRTVTTQRPTQHSNGLFARRKPQIVRYLSYKRPVLKILFGQDQGPAMQTYVRSPPKEGCSPLPVKQAVPFSFLSIRQSSTAPLTRSQLTLPNNISSATILKMTKERRANSDRSR